MKKVALTLALLSAALASPAMAAPSGELSLSTAYSTVTGKYPDGKSQTASAMFDLGEGYRVGGSVTNVDAWGGEARVFGVRAVTPLPDKNFWLDTSLSASDRDVVTIKQRASTMLNMKVAQKGLIVGVGADYYNMRSGGAARSLKLQAVYYVPKMPLVLQADVAHVQSTFNDRNGYAAGLTATYGHPGQWTVTGRVDTGRVHYELTSQPGTVADYNSKSGSVSVRYWMAKDWGITGGVTHVRNAVYERNEARTGLFMNF